MWKHLLRTGAIAAIGIGAAVVAEMLIPCKEENTEVDEVNDVIDITPEQ